MNRTNVKILLALATGVAIAIFFTGFALHGHPDSGEVYWARAALQCETNDLLTFKAMLTKPDGTPPSQADIDRARAISEQGGPDEYQQQEQQDLQEVQTIQDRRVAERRNYNFIAAVFAAGAVGLFLLLFITAPVR